MPRPRPTENPGTQLIEDLDLDLVAALQYAPRAPASALAHAVGTSSATVTRRLNRLREARLLRVVGRLDWPLITSEHPRLVWIHCEPGRSGEVAEQLSRLEEVQTLVLTTGSADVYCTVYPLLGSDIADLLTNRLPSLPGVVRTRSELVLRTRTLAQSWRLHRLGRPVLETLEPHTHQVTGARLSGLDQLTSGELQVMELLAGDGRITAADVARELGISRSVAYRTTQSLLERGAVMPRVEVEPSALGYPLTALVSLSVRPRGISEVLDYLGRHPSARYVAMVAGSFSLIHHGVYRDESELADFITEDLGAFPDITAMDTCVAIRVVRRHWMARDGSFLGERLPGFPGRLLRGAGPGPAVDAPGPDPVE